MAHILKSAYSFYNQHYQTRPILTICITNTILAGISDTLSQTYFAPRSKEIISRDHSFKDVVRSATGSVDTQVEIDKSAASSFNFARTGRFMFYNFSIAPLIHTWYGFIDRNFPINPVVSAPLRNTHVPAATKVLQTMTPALKRMMADQVLFAPIGLALLFSGLTVLEGGGVQEIKDKLKNTYLPTLKANYAVWPLVQLVNFSPEVSAKCGEGLQAQMAFSGAAALV
ncbi:hypothetical protein BGZ65_002808 [Modicella reniformis]|uniref:Uncharacterized protein n=1 Tax=Modicella reniformis TaxID=1440133 RepID=A0A9P6MIS7_9FUNG|nr:hypothetical protein BGZ65_002808 [Modicella reniformis]